MALVQAVENGQIVDSSASSLSTSSSTSSSGSTLDKDAFLQLLVAQMKYQDPLDPASNTEYVAQLATFSQLEETQNQTTAIEGQTADDLVGKQVIMKVTSSSTGETSYVSGQVDYVYRENGDVYLSVNDGLYSLDDLDTVVDDTYLDAVNLAQSFSTVVGLLPTVSACTTSDSSAITAAREIYDSMTEYQQQFVDSDDLATLEKLEAKITELKNQEAATSTDSSSSDSSDSSSSDSSSSDSSSSTDTAS